MSRNANPGERRTPVRFVTVTRTQDGESYYTESETVALETTPPEISRRAPSSLTVTLFALPPLKTSSLPFEVTVTLFAVVPEWTVALKTAPENVLDTNVA